MVVGLAEDMLLAVLVGILAGFVSQPGGHGELRVGELLGKNKKTCWLEKPIFGDTFFFSILERSFRVSVQLRFVAFLYPLLSSKTLNVKYHCGFFFLRHCSAFTHAKTNKGLFYPMKRLMLRRGFTLGAINLSLIWNFWEIKLGLLGNDDLGFKKEIKQIFLMEA